MQDISDFIKAHWHVYVAMVALCGLIGSGVGYYAKAEAGNLIKQELSKPIEKLEKQQEINRQKLNELQLDVTRNKEQLKSIDEKADIILQFLQQERNRR